MLINGFNIAAERVDLLIALVMLYLTVATKPRRTAVLSVVFYGQILSVANIILHMASIFLLSFDTALEGFLFRMSVLFYYVTYLGILVLLFSYIHLLSLKQRENLDTLNVVVIVFIAIYMVVVGGVFISDSYVTVIDGAYKFTEWFYVNVWFALLDVVLIVLSTFQNRNEIPRVLMNLIFIFVPFEVLTLVIQMIQPQYVILSVTYVVPFMLCYITFHSILYDEVTGCQNKQAFEAHLLSLQKKSKNGKHIGFIYIKFPRLEVVDNYELMYVAKRRISAQIRNLEQHNPDARVYSINEFTYGIIFPNNSEHITRETIELVKKDLDDAMSSWEYSNSPEYRMVVIKNDLEKCDLQTLDAYSNFLFDKAAKKKVRVYEATLSDYNICMEQKEIERVIVDIRNKDDLLDPRVVVYVQPIFDVTNNNYRNAEALMRLEVHGRLISPDIFIPLAEKVGCIHTLTRIILNKVCAKIYEIQDYYNFEAVSVNVSLSEFMDYCLHDELIDIIKNNGITCDRIRLEMTESMTSDEIEAISHNMEEFNAAGVHFYLDDFGTGYSNLERIVSLPFRTIKFDKSLLYKSMDDPILLRLIQNMVDVFKSHGLVVLVEGVENNKQAELSIGLGFEYIQGYKYAAPVPINKLEEFFEPKLERLA